jgi:lipoprotein NlpD
MEGIKPNTNLPQACLVVRWYKILVCFFCILFFMQLSISCCVSQEQKTQTKGVYHRVKKGETIWGIAHAYNIKLQDLTEINNIEDPALVKEDTIIFIPGAKQVIDYLITHPKNIDVQESLPTVADSPDSAKKSIENNGFKEEKKLPVVPPVSDKKAVVPPVTIEKKPPAKVLPAEEPVSKKTIPELKGKDAKIKFQPKVEPPAQEKEIIQGGKGRFIWPVQGSVKTRFGIQSNKTYHNWIKIASAAGTKVKAASSGTVIFSSALKDYGETIIIRHEKEFATVYTHLKKRYVSTDQNVKKGETIALVGQKDEAGSAYINFEIRSRGKARNPLLFLP